MIRKILLISVVVAMVVFYLGGCKKSESGTEPNRPQTKTQAEYETEAKEQINEDNMDAELERIEKELEEELSQQQ